MVAYLANGWFTQVGPSRLRAEVIDGAIDAAALLHQAQVPATSLDAVVLRLRTLVLLLGRSVAAHGPLAGRRAFGQDERRVLRHHLTEATDAHIALQALVLDCLDHVGDLAGAQALYLHLSHVVHLTKLLRLAQQQGHHSASAHQVPTSGHVPLSADVAPAAWYAPR